MNEKVVLDGPDIARTIVRIAHQIVEQTEGDRIAIVGIHRRGAVLARRLVAQVSELVGQDIPLGEIDISFYRDDVAMRDPARQPVVHASKIDFGIDGKTLILVDDVLYTGRTVRAAIDALFDYGRPQRIQLAVLADRGHRELPIRPDYVGKNLPTAQNERVQVQLLEVDEVDRVVLLDRNGGTELGARAAGPSPKTRRRSTSCRATWPRPGRRRGDTCSRWRISPATTSSG